MSLTDIRQTFGRAAEIQRRHSADRVTFFVDDKLAAAYVFGDASADRPYFFPLNGPDGAPMTRAFPIRGDVDDEPPEGEPQDHPHHRSLWAAHGDVNGYDNWHHGARTRHTGFAETMVDDAALIALGDWESAEDSVLLCRERLAVTLVPLQNDDLLLDWQLTLTAPEQHDVTFGDTKEGGLCALRLYHPLDGDHHGAITNADGGRGEKECWGRRSRWCDCSGPHPDLNGKVVGAAILHHPKSFRFPTGWHVRNYGLFAANPFGLGAFTGGGEDGAFTLSAGASLLFHCAVLLHAGDATVARVDALWDCWANNRT